MDNLRSLVPRQFVSREGAADALYLVILPVVRVRRIVHPYFEILSAREEEVAVIGELTGVAARIVVYNHVCSRRWNKILDGVRVYSMRQCRLEKRTCIAKAFILL